MTIEQLQKILTTILPQVILLLSPFGAGFWYFIQRKYNYKTKSLEMKQGLFQQNRLNHVVAFDKATSTYLSYCLNVLPVVCARRELFGPEFQENSKPLFEQVLQNSFNCGLFVSEEEKYLTTEIRDGITDLLNLYLEVFQGDHEAKTDDEIDEILVKQFNVVRSKQRTFQQIFWKSYH